MSRSKCSVDLEKTFGLDADMADSIVARVRGTDYKKHTKLWVKKTQQELDLAEASNIEFKRDMRKGKAEIDKIIASAKDPVKATNDFFINKYGGSRVAGELKLSVEVMKRTLRNETHNFLRQAMLGNGIEPEVGFKRLIDPAYFRETLRAMEALNNKKDVTKVADPSVVALAKSLNETFGRGLDNVIESGVHINKRADHLITQKLTHNQSKVKLAGPKQWIDDQMDALDFSRTFEELNGLRGKELEDARRFALKSVYDEIITATQSRGTGNITRSRKLNYLSADKFANIHEKYGEGTMLDLVQAQINGLAKAEALKVTIGNRAKDIMDDLESYAETQMAKQHGADASAKFNNTGFTGAKGVRTNLKKTVMGYDDTPAETIFTKIVDTLKNINLLKLGAAAANTITDPMIQIAHLQATTDLNFMKAEMKVFSELFNNIKSPTRKKRIGALLGMEIEQSINRYTGEDTNTKGAFGKFTNHMMKFTGLEWQTKLGHTTQAGLKSSWLAGQSHKSFGELPVRTQAHFKSFGIKSDDWDILRQAVDSDSVDISLITPAKLREVGGSRNLQNKYGAMIMHDSNFGAISPDARAKALLTFGMNPDSDEGKALSAAFMFKSFTIRAGGAIEEVLKSNPEANNATMFRALGNKGNLQLMSGMMANGIVLGIASLWARDLLFNKTPRDMTDPKNFAEAMSRMVIPLYGELFVEFLGGGMGERETKDLFLGPVLGGVADTMGALKTIRDDIVDSDRTGQKSANAIWKQLQQVIPGTYIPVIRPILDGVVYDSIGRLTNENYDRDKEKSMENKGQELAVEL